MALVGLGAIDHETGVFHLSQLSCVYRVMVVAGDIFHHVAYSMSGCASSLIG